MFLNKFHVIFVLLLCFEYGSSVKVCSSWLDFWNFLGANSCRESLDAEDEFATIVSRWGKKVETYELITYDGYILTLFRIRAAEENTPPVLLLHGLFMNSLALVNRGSKSLAYQFVDKGYDVWILNWRGTKYSRNHIGLSSFQMQYWKFSLHELGIYDLPQALKQIKSKNCQKVLIVGFAQGNTAAFIYASTYPDEAKKCLSGMVSLSPIGAPINVGVGGKLFILIPYSLTPLLKYFYHDEVPGIVQNIRATIFCRKSGIWVARFCDAYFMLLTGLDFMQQDPETLIVTVRQNKDSNSAMTFEHYFQMMRDRKFQQFDYGEDKNREKYGHNKPPEYDLEKIQVPQFFFLGKNDKIGTIQDGTVMFQHIPREYQKEFYVIEHDDFGLADFVQAKDINEFLHVPMMSKITDFLPPVPHRDH